MLKTLAAAAVAAFALAPALATSSLAEPPRPGEQPLDWCLLEGGDTIPQPPGSSIRACCADDGCFICDVNWNDCTFDPAMGPSAGMGRPSAPQADTMAPAQGASNRPGSNSGVVLQLIQR